MENNNRERDKILTTLYSSSIYRSEYVIVRPLSTVGYTSVAASVIHSRQRANYLNS